MLDLFDTEGDEFSLRGVCSGVVVVEEMAAVEMDCGRMTGLRLA